jgi:hypothetical protein
VVAAALIRTRCGCKNASTDRLTFARRVPSDDRPHRLASVAAEPEVTRKDGLLARFGADIAVPDLLADLAQRDRRQDFIHPCGARYVGRFGGGSLRATRGTNG